MARYYIEHYGYIDDDQHSLAHYGVRGMKWRRHRYRSNSNEADNFNRHMGSRLHTNRFGGMVRVTKINNLFSDPEEMERLAKKGINANMTASSNGDYDYSTTVTKNKNSNKRPTRGQGASYYGPKNPRKKPNGSGTGNHNSNVGAMATKRNNSERSSSNERWNSARHDREAQRREEMRRKRHSRFNR